MTYRKISIKYSHDIVLEPIFRVPNCCRCPLVPLRSGLSSPICSVAARSFLPFALIWFAISLLAPLLDLFAPPLDSAAAHIVPPLDPFS